MGSKGYFQQVAKEWDAMRKSFFSDAVRIKAADRAHVQCGKTAADLGAGTGFITEELLQRGLRVIAVDQSAAMLDLLTTKFGATGMIDCREGDAATIPVQTTSVDYAFANMYLHHVEDPASAIKEMTRILKPGGKMVITDLDEHQFEFLRTEQQDRWMGFKREDISRWFTEAGLTNVSVECLDEQCCTNSAGSSCSCTPQEAKVSIFIAYGERVPDSE